MLTKLTNLQLLKIKSLYDSPTRHYHTWENHICKMLSEFKKIQEHVTDKDAMVFAILFHDCVYNVDPKFYEMNEIASSTELLKFTRDEGFAKSASWVQSASIEKARNFIRATKTHAPDRDTLDRCELEDLKIFLDLDLLIFKSNLAALEEYEDQIRSEFSIYPDAVYYPQRVKVLKSFASRDKIFHSTLYDEFNQLAKSNLIELILKIEERCL